MQHLPTRKESRTLDALHHIREQGCKRVAVYGAGKHTQDILPLLRVTDLCICAILDDRASDNSTFFEFNLYPTIQLPNLQVDAVLLSSDAFESQMFEKLSNMQLNGVKLFRIYHPDNTPTFLSFLLDSLERLAKMGVKETFLFSHYADLQQYSSFLNFSCIKISGVIMPSAHDKDACRTRHPESSIAHMALIGMDIPPEQIPPIIFIEYEDYIFFTKTAHPRFRKAVALVANDPRLATSSSYAMRDALIEQAIRGRNNFVILGDGVHTISALPGIAVTSCTINGFVDDASEATELAGWPVYNMDQINDLTQSHLLVSSVTNENILFMKAKACAGKNMEISRVYLRSFHASSSTPSLPVALMATDIRFWMNDKGSATRISHLLHHIHEEGSFTPVVYFAGQLRLDDVEALHRHYPNLMLFYSDVPGRYLFDYRTNDYTTKTLRDFYSTIQRNEFYSLLETLKPQTCIVEYIRLSFLMESMPDHLRHSCSFAIDTHDIMHARAITFSGAGIDHWLRISRDEEIAALAQFDIVIAIQNKEYKMLQDMLPTSHVELVGHAEEIMCSRRPSLDGPVQIGYFATRSEPNIHAIQHFIDIIWPSIDTSEAEMRIFGTICTSIRIPNGITNIHLEGFVEDLQESYKLLDIIVNPVRFGGGIKIKNVEAICKGLPLLTTSHGAEGLESGAGTAFLVENSDKDFAKALSSLISKPELRQSISNKAIQYAETHLSCSAVYDPLLALFKQKLYTQKEGHVLSA